jgi:hypothetical protein
VLRTNNPPFAMRLRRMGHPIDVVGEGGVGGLREKPHVSDDETVANMGHPMLSDLVAKMGYGIVASDFFLGCDYLRR